MIYIPARLESQRLPKKLLLGVNGKPVLRWTWEHAKAVAPTTIVTDSKAIRDAAIGWGATVVYDVHKYANGTERIKAVAEGGFILHGDEPLVPSESISQFISVQSSFHFPRMIAGCLKSANDSRSDVKITGVLMDEHWGYGKIKGFSRDHGILEVVGLSYFDDLSLYSSGGGGNYPNSFSKRESIEQARWLEGRHKHDLIAVQIKQRATAIDTEEDLKEAAAWLSSSTSMAS